ncbi:MAG TPA: hypothetical protein VHZ51_08640 [Ktedonobacteraceae bacterium]|jgi:hypothetical protein|nr:hypothetical protein [Ktedonobacteraceae bacterium]
MAALKLLMSDLHLADGSASLECFGQQQQAAFQGLLSAVSLPQGPFGRADDVELIINGDCFDFYGTRLYASQRAIHAEVALQKIGKILAVHSSFLAVLRAFIVHPGRSVTFMLGNHDIELAFAAVRARICAAITERPRDKRIKFCVSRSYRLHAALYIEHGNGYDFWNHVQQDLWDEQGQPLHEDPQTLLLPLGTWYFQYAMHPITIRYPYFDHFEPSIGITRQIALLSLLDPELIMQVAQRSQEMMSSAPQSALANLTPEDIHTPAQLFERAVLDFKTFQDDMMIQKLDWTPPPSESTGSADDLALFMHLREALTHERTEAVAAIFASLTQVGDVAVARGMYAVLHADKALYCASAGHTHMRRFDRLAAALYSADGRRGDARTARLACRARLERDTIPRGDGLYLCAYCYRR